MDSIFTIQCDVLLQGSGEYRRGQISSVWRTLAAVGFFGLLLVFDLEAQIASPAIVETDGGQARATSQIRVQTAPEIQIGVADGNPAYMFSNVSGVAILPGERIVVVDAGSAELRFYDLQGRFLSRLGRRGQGPGEFYEPRLLNRVAEDSIVIYDSRYNRFTVYSSDGDAPRTFSSPSAVGGRIGMSASTGQILTLGARMSVPLRPGMHGTFPTTVVASVLDVARSTADTIATAAYTQVAISSPGRPSSMSSAPFSWLLPVAADRNRFFIAAPNEPSVREYSWTGELMRTFRLVEPVNRLTEAEWSAAVDGEIDRRSEGTNIPPADIRDVYRGLEPPEVEPTFRSLLIDDEGWLWAQTYDVSAESEVPWLLFDAAGRGRGSVTMPEGLSVNTISRDYVAGVWRDDLGVEHVRLHRIVGRP